MTANMTADTQKFVLRSTVTSPFGRKVRMAADVLGLNARIALVPGDPLDENDPLRQQNPLGKLPCLLSADGDAIYDSRVIVEFLQDVAGSDALLPAQGPARFKALTRAALADGITDAALLMVYESRFRDPDKHSERWMAHQRGKFARGLAAFETSPPDAAKTDIVGIGLACALGYLDWRKPVEWRSGHPKLVAWFAGFIAREPRSSARARRRPERNAMTLAQHNVDTPAAAPYWMAEPSKPKLKLPPGACDAHVHVFGPRARFPFADGRNYTPADATKEMLFALHERLGIQHCVVVQPNCHGFDNAVTEDVVTATGGAYRGIALVPVTVADAELKRLAGAGLCGARFHYMGHLNKGASIDDAVAFGKRLATIGWHLQIHMEGSLIGDLTPAIKRSPVPVMIDHMGRIDAALGLEQPGFINLLRLMDDKNVWVKVSGVDRITQQGPPYADAVPFARKLMAEFGDRVVWGTDWPHPNHTHRPDDGMLVDILAEIAPSEAARQALLVDNPQRFYKFAGPRKLNRGQS